MQQQPNQATQVSSEIWPNNCPTRRHPGSMAAMSAVAPLLASLVIALDGSQALTSLNRAGLSLWPPRHPPSVRSRSWNLVETSWLAPYRHSLGWIHRIALWFLLWTDFSDEMDNLPLVPWLIPNAIADWTVLQMFIAFNVSIISAPICSGNLSPSFLSLIFLFPFVQANNPK